MATPAVRDVWLTLDDAALLAQCDVETRRVGGPGGQKRNKTSSAIRLHHRPSGVSVVAGESRSQSEKKARALRRLRLALALQCREPVEPGTSLPDVVSRHRTPSGGWRIPDRHPDYPLLAAVLLDVIDAHGGRISEAAARLSVTTAKLAHWITDAPKIMAIVNQIRRRGGLRPLSGKRRGV